MEFLWKEFLTCSKSAKVTSEFLIQYYSKWGYQTISSHFIFFTKRFWAYQKHQNPEQTISTLLEVFVRAKNRCLCCIHKLNLSLPCSHLLTVCKSLSNRFCLRSTESALLNQWDRISSIQGGFSYCWCYSRNLSREILPGVRSWIIKR